MFKNLLDYNSQENQWLRNHDTSIKALAAGLFIGTIAAVGSACVHEAVRIRKPKTDKK